MLRNECICILLVNILATFPNREENSLFYTIILNVLSVSVICFYACI